MTEQGGIFVTVQDTGGNFGLSGQTSVARAVLGGLAGLAKTADQEWPSATVRAIDLERGDRDTTDLAQALADELLRGAGTEVEIGLRADGQRITLESYEAPVDGDPADLPVSKDSVIVATGGARGVTAATLIELARQAATHGEGAPRFVLLGRTQLQEEPEICRGVEDSAELKKLLLQKALADGEKVTPMELGKRVSRLQSMREIRTTLSALKAAGSEAQYLPVDVQDANGLAAAFNAVRGQWGPITGLIHGAGVIADKVIAEKTDESLRPSLRHQNLGSPSPARRYRQRSPRGHRAFLLRHRPLRQRRPKRLRHGQRGAEQNRRRRATPSRWPLPGEVPQLGGLGSRHGDPGAEGSIRGHGRRVDSPLRGRADDDRRAQRRGRERDRRRGGVGC